MGKLIYMYIAAAFFMGNLYVSLYKNNDYLDTLNDKEREMRDKVVKERMKIYLFANLCAILLVGLLIFNNLYLEDRVNNMWMYTAIYFLTEYFVYSLHPKKYWMLHSVENKQDAIDWLEKYKYMKRNWHIGLLLGIFSVSIFTYNYFDNAEYNINNLDNIYVVQY